jgi:hypothetical protein
MIARQAALPQVTTGAGTCSNKQGKEMTPEQMRADNPLISTSPDYVRYLAAKAIRELVQRITAPASAAVSGYRDELHRMLDASAVYLGPGR